MEWDRLRRALGLRLRSLARRNQVENELDEELRFHVEAQIVEYRRMGIGESEARERSVREFRALERSKEECRDARRVIWIEDFFRDARHGLRLLRKSPGFALVAVVTLGLGIGANTAVFSVVNAVLLQPLPYPEPGRLYSLPSNESLPDLEDIRSQTDVFAAIGGLTTQPLDFIEGSTPRQITGGLCNADFHKALGVQPMLGRWLSADEDRFGGPRVVVLTYGFWRDLMGARQDVIGKTVRLSGESYTVIGVMPAEFWKPRMAVDVLVPLRVTYPLAAQFRGVHFLETYFRLKPGASLEVAQSQLQRANDWLSRKYPDENTGRQRILQPLSEAVSGKVRPLLLVLFAAVVVVLLISCVNFANLLLARAAVRQREMVTRTALGARFGRLLRQSMAETIPLALLGGAVGLVVAKLGIQLLLVLKPPQLVRLSFVGIDTTVLLFTLGICLGVGVVFGLLPAFGVLRMNAVEGLKEAGRSVTASRSSRRVRRVLAGSEIALGMILLTATGLLVRSFQLLHTVDPGFRTENVLTARVELPESRYREIEKQRRFRERLIERIESGSPRIEAAMVSELPMSGRYLTHNFLIEGRPPVPPGQEPEVQTRTIEGRYFQALGIPLLKGRDFDSRDRAGGLHVSIVNAALVRQYFPDEDPIGRRVSWARGPRDWMTIVGVVGDVRHFGPAHPEEPAVYDHYQQTAQPWKRWMAIVARGGPQGPELLNRVQASLWALDRELPLTQVATMAEVEEKAVSGQRFNLTLMGLFGLLAVSLAAVGVYGTTAYLALQRTHEIGLRISLGANRGDILRLMVRDSLGFTLAGIGVGLVGALGFARLMEGMLFGIGPRDPITLAVVAAALGLVALGASCVPTLRAMRTDPMVTLRHE